MGWERQHPENWYGHPSHPQQTHTHITLTGAEIPRPLTHLAVAQAREGGHGRQCLDSTAAGTQRREDRFAERLLSVSVTQRFVAGLQEAGVSRSQGPWTG